MEEPDVEVGEQGIQELSQLGLVVVCTLRNPHLDISKNLGFVAECHSK
jgi:hypothetical protein